MLYIIVMLENNILAVGQRTSVLYSFHQVHFQNTKEPILEWLGATDHATVILILVETCVANTVFTFAADHAIFFVFDTVSTDGTLNYAFGDVQHFFPICILNVCWIHNNIIISHLTFLLFYPFDFSYLLQSAISIRITFQNKVVFNDAELFSF